MTRWQTSPTILLVRSAMKIALLLALAAAALAQKTRYDGYLMIYYIFTFFFYKLNRGSI